jgi:hypothetical protein
MKFWRFWKKVEVPVVPKISALIAAGDDLVYTSALFDSIPANYDEVCWRGIYEAFFDELAWTDPKNNSYLEDTSFLKLREYEKAGKDHVLQLRKAIAAIDKDPHPNAFAHDADGATSPSTLLSHIPRKLESFLESILRVLAIIACWRYNKKKIDTRNDTLSDLENQALQKAYRDRHVLYEADYNDGPYLVNCVRRLNTIFQPFRTRQAEFGSTTRNHALTLQSAKRRHCY